MNEEERSSGAGPAQRRQANAPHGRGPRLAPACTGPICRVFCALALICVFLAATTHGAAVQPAGKAGTAAVGRQAPAAQNRPASRAASPKVRHNATQAAAGAATLPPDEARDAASVWPPGPAGDAARAYAAGDLATARRLWEELAESGDGQAMNNLGVLYDQGRGVEPDTGRALHWFARSAQSGNPSGMSNYGRMLEQGRGMEANPAEAARWFDLAARKGQAEAQYNLGYMYEQGRGVPRDDAAAAAWYSRAAAQRQREALGRLGHFYRTGRGVQRDEGRAALLLYAAAMEGLDAAVDELRRMAAPDSPPVVLFGQKLDSATRRGMRDALKKAGAPARREDDAHICDIYDARGVVPGAEEMAVCYGSGTDPRVAFVKIDYAAPDRSRADAVLAVVRERFGTPTAGEGEDARLWNLGPTILATQYAPTHGQMSLMYMVPEVYHQTRR